MGQIARPTGLLLDIDGVLYVGDDPIPGAIEALAELRELTDGIRLLTNTTSKPRRRIHEHLVELGFEVAIEEVLTPAALAVRHCREAGLESVHLMVADALREDLGDLSEVPDDAERCDAIVLGDIGEGFTPRAMNRAFRLMLGGAELIALQHNRYWKRSDGLVLDVGAWSMALEYAAGREAVTVGKPDLRFFEAALADLDIGAVDALMVGDDVEADVGGALAAGISAVLVRTGKYRSGEADALGIEPTATIDTVAGLPAMLA